MKRHPFIAYFVLLAVLAGAFLGALRAMGQRGYNLAGFGCWARQSPRL